MWKYLKESIMTAQILYFPNQGTTFRPDPLDQPLSISQLESLKDRVVWVSSFFDDDRDQLASLHIYNKLRVTFCVRRIEDIPQRHFEEAISLINQARDVLCSFRAYTREIDKLFTEKVLRAGDPWTPSLQAKFRKQMAKALPDRPDWREMAKELEERS
jgi:hypothetical protein